MDSGYKCLGMSRVFDSCVYFVSYLYCRTKVYNRRDLDMLALFNENAETTYPIINSDSILPDLPLRTWIRKLKSSLF